MDFKAIKISENVHWVGVVDWELADFHGYTTPNGSTYNAFLIQDEKTVLIDGVKAPFVDEMLSRIKSVIDPQEIDIVVSNHAEMDHSGGLPALVAAIKPEAVYASAKGVDALKRHLNPDFEIQVVSEGQEMGIGAGTLTFMMTSMVHWPDSMFTHYDRDGVLFSNDAFGMHLASTERWTDEIDPAVIRSETATYYANILWPTSKAVQGVLKKYRAFEKETKVIAPDHGPLWRGQGIEDVLGWYDVWAAGEVQQKKVVVLFDTMWGSTAKMARAIAEGLGQGGVSPRLLPLSKTPRSVVATEILEASALVVGSPALNSGIFPTLADALTYIKGLKPSKPVIQGAVFGSYGWSPAVQKNLGEMVVALGVELIEDPMKVQYVPGSEDLAGCVALGQRIAEKVLNPGENESEA